MNTSSIDFAKLLIKTYDHWELYLYRKQAHLGRCYLWAKEDNDREWWNMGTTRLLEEMRIMQDLGVALNTCFQPDRINTAWLQNENPHLHMHIIPRYETPRIFDNITFTDTNTRGPPWPYDKNFPVPDTTIVAIRDAIKDALGR
jgi:diadenosine tetraphosphate (Ap4A) HIT family hydrolase